MENISIFLIVVVVLVFVIGFQFGKTKKGHLTNYTNTSELSNVLYTVIYTDKKRTILQENTPRKKDFLVSTNVFGGKPIRAKDIVRKIKSTGERTSLGIPFLGYPPLVKNIPNEKKYCHNEHHQEKVERGKSGHFHTGEIKPSS